MDRLEVSPRFSEATIQVSRRLRRVHPRRPIVRSRWNNEMFLRKSIVHNRRNRDILRRKSIALSRWNRKTLTRKPTVRSRWNREAFPRRPAGRRVSSNLRAGPHKNSNHNAAGRNRKKNAARNARTTSV